MTKSTTTYTNDPSELVASRKLGPVEIVKLQADSLDLEPQDVSRAVATMEAGAPNPRVARWANNSNILGRAGDVAVPESLSNSDIQDAVIAQSGDEDSMIQKAREQVGTSFAGREASQIISQIEQLNRDNFNLAV